MIYIYIYIYHIYESIEIHTCMCCKKDENVM